MRSPLRQFKAEFFKALAHPGRIKIIESLRSGGKTVGAIQALVADEQASASQHLALLRATCIVDGRKNGSKVYYTVRGPRVFQLLDVAREIFRNHLVGSRELLDELADEEKSATEGAAVGGLPGGRGSLLRQMCAPASRKRSEEEVER